MGFPLQKKIALDQMTSFYYSNTEAFNITFEEMYLPGKPKIRKYCSPLQALFWLFEDGQKDTAKDIILKYDLLKLLHQTYVSNDPEIMKSKWKRGESKRLLDSCTDREIVNNANELIENNLSITLYLIEMAKKQPEKFDYVYDENNFQVLKERHSDRWRKLNKVADRLNFPELANFYVFNNFSYYTKPSYSITEMFRRKGGHCRSFARFVTYSLRRAGYDATNIRFKKSSIFISTSIMRKDNLYWVVMDFFQPRKILGPFHSIKEALGYDKIIEKWTDN